MKPLEAVLGFHLDLPPGSDRALLDRAWRDVLHPLVAELSNRPRFPVVLQLSGSLLDHLEQAHPQAIEALRSLSARGRIAWLTGGYYHPPLAAIPERDAMGQVRLARRRLEQLAGVGFEGLRPAYGAWDPELPRLAARARMPLAVVDEAAFLRGGMPPGSLRGWYRVEREGNHLAVFPDHGGQEPAVVDGPPEGMIAALRRLADAGREQVVWLLDARELGLRPGGRNGAWGSEGWVPRLLALVAGEDHWLKVTTPREILRRTRPAGSACPVAAVEQALHDRLAAAGGLARAAALPWETTFVVHEEAQRLHERMHAASQEVVRLASAVRTSRQRVVSAPLTVALERSLLFLFQGQAAAACTPDPWGGLYQGAIRHRAWANLLRAEAEVSRALQERPRFRIDAAEGDLQGRVVVGTPGLRAVLVAAQGGALVEVDALHVPANLANVLRRRSDAGVGEPVEAADLPALVGPARPLHLPPDGGLPEDLRGGAPVPEAPLDVAPVPVRVEDDGDGMRLEILDEDEEADTDGRLRPPGVPTCSQELLAWDRFRRGWLHDHFLGSQATLRNVQLGRYPEHGDFLDGDYDLLRAEPDADGGVLEVVLARDGVVRVGRREHLVRVVRNLRFQKDTCGFDATWEVSNRSREPLSSRFGVGLDLNLDSLRDGRVKLDAGGEPVPLDAASERLRVWEVTWQDVRWGLRLHLEWEPQATLWTYPIETPCLGPGGLRPEFQGTSLLAWWHVSLWGEERRVFKLRVRLDVGMPRG